MFTCCPQSVVISLPEDRCWSRILAAWRLPSIDSQKNDRLCGKIATPGGSTCTVLDFISFSGEGAVVVSERGGDARG